MLSSLNCNVYLPGVTGIQLETQTDSTQLGHQGHGAD